MLFFQQLLPQGSIYSFAFPGKISQKIQQCLRMPDLLRLTLKILLQPVSVFPEPFCHQTEI